MQIEAELSDSDLAALVDRFYSRVRADSLIGPVFNGAVHDWPEHLEKLAQFWSSVMTSSGRYKGSPVAAHLKHADVITPAMFGRWLELWAETTSEMLAPPVARQMQEKAIRIAESLKLAIQFRPGQALLPSEAQRPGKSYRPYRVTPIFDQDSLPLALRREHRTKAGVWGVIRVLEGEVRLHFADGTPSRDLSRKHAGMVEPEQTHWVEALGPMRMRVEFHDAPPRV